MNKMEDQKSKTKKLKVKKLKIMFYIPKHLWLDFDKNFSIWRKVDNIYEFEVISKEISSLPFHEM